MWGTIAILAFGMLLGGVSELMRLLENVAGVVHLGYLPDLVTIVGTWKVVCTLAVLAPNSSGSRKGVGVSRILFNVNGVAISDAVSGDPAWPVLVAGGLARRTTRGSATRQQSARCPEPSPAPLGLLGLPPVRGGHQVVGPLSTHAFVYPTICENFDIAFAMLHELY